MVSKRYQNETAPDDTAPDDAVTTGDEHPDAAKVRAGELSAAQLAGGHGNVDPDNPDAQYPPGVVQNSQTRASASADYPGPARNTSAIPDFE